MSIEEIDRLCNVFINKGVRKLRLSGGEPLVRQDIMMLVKSLGKRIGKGLDELTLTTNGSQLARYADDLYASGVRRLNVSLDTLDAVKFREITRRGDFAKVMEGIDVALAVGLKVKLNAVALKGFNEFEVADMIRFAHGRDMDLTVIETMPMGNIEGSRVDRYLPLSDLRRNLEQCFKLVDIPFRTGGPARYVEVQETGGRLGFITPMTHNFCEGCNRVRLTCTGTLYMCLGQSDAADLRAILRRTDDDRCLSAAIDEAISRKPKGHDFIIDREHNVPTVARHMSVTGG